MQKNDQEIAELREQVLEELDILTEREKFVVARRLGLHNETREQQTLKAIGKELNISLEGVRQIFSKGMRKLRHPSRQRVLNFLHQYLFLVPSEFYSPRFNEDGTIKYPEPRKLTEKEIRENELRNKLRLEKKKKEELLGAKGLFDLRQQLLLLLKGYEEDSLNFTQQKRISIELRMKLWKPDFYHSYDKETQMRIWEPRVYDFGEIGWQLKIKSESAQELFEEAMYYACSDPQFLELMNRYLETFMYPTPLPVWMDENRLIKVWYAQE